MAPPNVAYPNNPIELRSARACRVMGKLIESWSTSEDLLPKGARREADGRLIVFTIAAFHDLVSGLPEDDRLEAREVLFRDGVTEIEILLRRPDRLAMVMPEPEAITHQREMLEKGWPIAVHLPDIYRKIDHDAPNWAELWCSDDNVSDRPPYELRVGGNDPLDAFLHPFMAGYCCGQCS